MANSADYYGDQSQWGKYKNMTLEKIVTNYLAFRSSDDINKTASRHKILYHARRGLRELYYDVLREIKAIEIELPPNLTITMPPDYVNYVRLSWVDEEGQLHPMAVNERMSMAHVYLQDNEYELLFDETGCVLEANEVADASIDPVESDNLYNQYHFCYNGFQPNRNLSNVYPNGTYNIDNQRGIISFSSDVFGKKVVLEYISDGL